ncbi:penicillin-binding protein [Phocicoccus pinnipedialis]|uniref:Penicillin-binding protein 2B n=1 Tax=Phocicoccus pinnipedialis TaxID=110845 RepID=A0A6V7RIL2_9BACL|nr:penicillin-binding protein [Jeotgalicoccus pinnipedialis]MBP1939036.1 penicillin-binding protein 1 [Jeotgalicoccus pinnipedialis]CAD2077069.1 Penicillin-binding protein 2B [Jeotgalicoccus pinnipedialis]
MKNRMSKDFKAINTHNIPKFTLLIYIILGVFFALIVINFIILMIFKSIDDSDLEKLGEEKFTRSIILESNRGQILDRHGEILASDMEAYRIAVIVDDNYPNHLTDKKKVAKELSTVMSMSEKEIIKMIDEGIKSDRFQVEFGTKGRNVSYKNRKLLESKELDGLTFLPETKRFYPNGVFASHIIGFAEPNEDGKLVGSLGIEREYNEELDGKSGFSNYTQDIWSYVVPGTLETESAIDGMDVELTLDSSIQLYLEESLDEMQKYFEPKELFAFVADAKTGEILGAGQRPSFNPDTREGFGNSWLNMLYEYQFEPGSTFKVFGLAAAIEEGKYNSNEYYETGSRDVMDSTIYDWETEGWGTITYNEGMQYSSNTLMMDLQDKVGADKMLDYYKKFGFGEVTGSEFSTEASGQIAWDNELQQKTSSFGQTLSVTPIQMIQGMTALLNDGMMKKPYIVKSVTDPKNGNTIYEGKETNVRQVISKEAAQKTVEEMNTLVGGTLDRNPMYQLDDYGVTGKSGTAQIYDEEIGGYIDEPYQFITSFIGYAPKDDPQVIVYYGVKQASENKSDTWDYGVSLGFNPLMERTLKYLEVTDSSEGINVNEVKVEDYTDRKIEDIAVLTNDSLNVITSGKSEVIKDHYPKNTTLIKNDTIYVKTEGALTMPDMRELSKREVITLLDFLGIKASIKGEGYVKSQSIAPGTELGKKSSLTIQLDSNDPNN